MRLSGHELAQAMQTYAITAPPSTHFRPATCAEVECTAMRNGWRSVIDESSTLGQMQAHYITKESGRKFTKERDAAGLTVFTFEPGQNCFAEHKVPLERPANYLVRAGNTEHRGGLIRRHTSPESWIDDLHTTTDAVQAAQAKG